MPDKVRSHIVLGVITLLLAAALLVLLFIPKPAKIYRFQGPPPSGAGGMISPSHNQAGSASALATNHAFVFPPLVLQAV
jgi:hypothetical protein